MFNLKPVQTFFRKFNTPEELCKFLDKNQITSDWIVGITHAIRSMYDGDGTYTLFYKAEKEYE